MLNSKQEKTQFYRYGKKKHKRYRLKPEAQKRYRRILALLGGLCSIVLLMRMTVFRKTYTLAEYDIAKPFEIADLLYEVISPDSKDDVFVTDVSMTASQNSVITGIRLGLVQTRGNKKAQSWELTVQGAKSQLKKCARADEKMLDEQGSFPPLESTLNALSKLPLTDIARTFPIQEDQQYLFDTSAYRPDVNPAFSGRAAETGAQIVWVPRSGSSTSSVTANWKAISDYMAVDCVVTKIEQDKNAGESSKVPYIYLLEVRIN